MNPIPAKSLLKYVKNKINIEVLNSSSDDSYDYSKFGSNKLSKANKEKKLKELDALKE